MRDLVVFENSAAMNNPVLMMKVLARDCSKQAQWMEWIKEGGEGVGGDVPVSIVYGERDGMFSVKQCRSAGHILGVPEHRFEPVSKAGHLCMLEQPDSVNRIINDFVLQFSPQTTLPF